MNQPPDYPVLTPEQAGMLAKNPLAWSPAPGWLLVPSGPWRVTLCRVQEEEL